MELSSSDRLCIAGLPGTGKTTLMRYLMHMAEPDIYIIDPLNQYEEFGEVGDTLDQSKKRWVPKYETPQEFEGICKKLWMVSNTTIAVEEAEQFLPQESKIPPFTSGLIRMGRNWGIGMYLTTRRIQDLNKRFFDLCQHVIFFRCGLASRDYIANLIGNEYVYPAARPQYNKTGFTVSNMPPFHFLDFNLTNETAEVCKLKLISGGVRVENSGKKSPAPIDKAPPTGKEIKGLPAKPPLKDKVNTDETR